MQKYLYTRKNRKYLDLFYSTPSYLKGFLIPSQKPARKKKEKNNYFIRVLLDNESEIVLAHAYTNSISAREKSVARHCEDEILIVPHTFSSKKIGEPI